MRTAFAPRFRWTASASSPPVTMAPRASGGPRAELFRKELNMSACVPHLIACLGLVLLFGPATAEPDDKEIGRLIKQMSSRKFRQREEAMKRLQEMSSRKFRQREEARKRLLESWYLVSASSST